MRNLSPLVLFLTAATASAGRSGDCSFSEKRSMAAPTAGVTSIVIIGRAGTLHIGGRRGSAEVRANGTACTSSRDLLSQTTLTLVREGSALRIEAVVPEGTGMFSHAKLDFGVDVPDNIPLHIEDGSGELTIENVGPSDVTDGSGDLAIRNVSGDLSVRDGSGDMTLENVAGHVHIDDGSGGIEVKGAGSVEIGNDGSGPVDIRNVKHDVIIGSKGSGSIEVSDIGGNFRVAHKGSGSITWERVAGHVDVPERYRKQAR